MSDQVKTILVDALSLVLVLMVTLVIAIGFHNRMIKYDNSVTSTQHARSEGNS